MFKSFKTVNKNQPHFAFIYVKRCFFQVFNKNNTVYCECLLSFMVCIKCNSSCQSVARNLFYFLHLYQELDKADQLIILSVLKNNCYFLHPENILLAAVSDNDQMIRRLAVDKIIEVCLNVARDGIRTFDKNNIILNLAAKSYYEIIDWKQCTVTSPPLLSYLSNEQLTFYQQIILSHIPCYSQAVERAMKDITAAKFMATK